MRELCKRRHRSRFRSWTFERGQVGLAALYALASPVLAVLGLFAALWLIRSIA
jgi:hypothetical protein